MASVTQRVKEVKQPKGGYLPMKYFAKEPFYDGIVLNENENIHATIVGLTVDYLTRFMMGDSVDDAFHISYMGATLIDMQNKATFLKHSVTGLDDTSITSACRLAGFDVCLRASTSAYKPVENINPDESTIENIRTMVNRSLIFWKKYGPIICSEPIFVGGYTRVVNSGDGDFLTKDTLWDFKVSKYAPTTKHSLQILMYYVMGIHSIHEHYKNISNLGFFNPRLNIAYICPISSISKKTIEDIESNVICYEVVANSHQEVRPQCKPKQEPTNALTVAAACLISGFKKSQIHADIRSGELAAYKKGNKYFILKSDFDDYVRRIEFKNKLIMGISLGGVIAAIAIVLLTIIFA